MFLHGFQIHRVPYWKLWKRTRDSRFWSILHRFVDKYKILGLPKKFIWVFYNIIWKNPSELSGPLNAIVLTVLSIAEKIVKEGVQSWKIKDLGSEREKSWKLQSHTKIQDGKGNGNPLQYFCLGDPMDRGVLQATVRGVAKELETVRKRQDISTEDAMYSLVTIGVTLAHSVFKGCWKRVDPIVLSQENFFF